MTLQWDCEELNMGHASELSIQKNKIVGIAAVAALAVAAGALYYWKHKRRPVSSHSSRISSLRPSSMSRSEEKCVIFCDKYTDAMSYTSFGSRGRYAGYRCPPRFGDIRDVTSARPPICGRTSRCSCRVTTCDHTKCECGSLVKMRSSGSPRCAIPSKIPKCGSRISTKSACSCSSTITKRSLC